VLPVRYELNVYRLCYVEESRLSLVSAIEELLERKSSGSVLEILHYGRRGSAALTTGHRSLRKSWH
jgi:hypothetical protein